MTPKQKQDRARFSAFVLGIVAIFVIGEVVCNLVGVS